MVAAVEEVHSVWKTCLRELVFVLDSSSLHRCCRLTRDLSTFSVRLWDRVAEEVEEGLPSCHRLPPCRHLEDVVQCLVHAQVGASDRRLAEGRRR